MKKKIEKKFIKNMQKGLKNNIVLDAVANTKPRQTGKKEEFIYTIKDKYFPDLQVLNTANAWWLDKGKVDNLISAFKFDAPIEEAIVYAGISKDQYKYFIELHPNFSTIKEACKELPSLRARETVVTQATKNYSNAMDYLSRKKKAEFSQRQEVSNGTPKDFSKDAKDKAKKAIQSFGRGNTGKRE